MRQDPALAATRRGEGGRVGGNIQRCVKFTVKTAAVTVVTITVRGFRIGSIAADRNKKDGVTIRAAPASFITLLL